MSLSGGAKTATALVKVPKPEPKKPDAPAIPQPENGMIEGVSLSTLNTIAACESGGDPTAVNAAGYYGKYQFDEGTWAAVGGSGNPAEAPEAEQDYRAALLYSQSGSQPLARLRRLTLGGRSPHSSRGLYEVARALPIGGRERLGDGPRAGDARNARSSRRVARGIRARSSEDGS